LTKFRTLPLEAGFLSVLEGGLGVGDILGPGEGEPGTGVDVLRAPGEGGLTRAGEGVTEVVKVGGLKKQPLKAMFKNSIKANSKYAVLFNAVLLLGNQPAFYFTGLILAFHWFNNPSISKP
jgi:hypothetical protein